jgi:hypothetical protein
MVEDMERAAAALTHILPAPLTDDQIIDIWAGASADHDDTVNIIALARAIEYALRAPSVDGLEP